MNEPATTDSLLLCLQYLSKHYGNAKSKNSLIAGLPYDGKAIGPDLFCQAAQRIGLKTQVNKRNTLHDIPRAVLPAVIILRDESACLLLSRKDGFGTIYLTETN